MTEKFVQTWNHHFESQFNCSAEEDEIEDTDVSKAHCNNHIEILDDFKRKVLESQQSSNVRLRKNTVNSILNPLSLNKYPRTVGQLPVSHLLEIANTENKDESMNKSNASEIPASVKENAPENIDDKAEIDKPTGISIDESNKNDIQQGNSSENLKIETEMNKSPSGCSKFFTCAKPSKKPASSQNDQAETKNETFHSKGSITIRRSLAPSQKPNGEGNISLRTLTSNQAPAVNTETEAPKRNLVLSIRNPDLPNENELKVTSVQQDRTSSQFLALPDRNSVASFRKSSIADPNRKISTFVSRLSQSLRAPSGRSPLSKRLSPNQASIDLCSRILKYCEETHDYTQSEGNPFQNCAPEELYDKISSMGVEGDEFLKNAQNFLDQSRPSISVSSRKSKYTINAPRNSLREGLGGRSEMRSPQISTSKMSLQNINFGKDTVKEKVREAKYSESKPEEARPTCEPEVKSLLSEIGTSLHLANEILGNYDKSDQKRDEQGIEPGQSTTDANKNEISTDCMARVSNLYVQPQIKTVDNRDLKDALNDIRQQIQGIECKHQSGSEPEVLSVLNDVKDSLKSISEVQQRTQSLQPEVLSSLEDIQRSIYNAEERSQQVQERGNQEIIGVLDNLAQSIHSIEATNNDRDEVGAQQIITALDELRLTVSSLKEISAKSENNINPKVAGLLSEIRSSVRFMESSRAGQRNSMEMNMMGILQDIKQSLSVIEDKRTSLAPQRPNLSMFVIKQNSEKSSKEEHINGQSVRESRASFPSTSSKTKRDSNSVHETGVSISDNTQSSMHLKNKASTEHRYSVDPYIKKSLEDIKHSLQQLNSPKPSLGSEMELKQSINEFKEEMRSILDRQSDRITESQSFRRLSENLNDIRTGMKSLIDTIPVIVNAAITQQTSDKIKRKSKKKNRSYSSESDSSESEEYKNNPDIEMQSTVGVRKPWVKSEHIQPQNAVRSVEQLPSSFTFSFVKGPPQLDNNEQLIMDINGKRFKCSRV